ncbi:hypothetical protein HFP15_24720 [Amycolatopsis sp. K13G38]|uniref:GNAT family N-acetyltransferase n=1 Tax=Amycolatopsis acididurans TaxID=2724524 RepID=A0ABX1J8H8_9PSEU|nr:hypothetical protein [Amycolatopsis acididurans]NKQ56087.1 hypothetical protein [Amycolatopsis acididurans]
MIGYEWLDRLDPPIEREVADLVASAAAFDQEMGFSKVTLRRAGGTGSRLFDPEPRTYHLLTRLTHNRRWPAQPLVTYLRLDVSCVHDTGTAHVVVRPEFRSLGIATLLFELLALDTSAGAGWSATGVVSVQAWAHGSHPAAQRMAARFGATDSHRLWRLCRPLTGPGLDTSPLPAQAGDVVVRPVSADEPGLAEEVTDLVAAIRNRVPCSQPRPEPDIRSAQFFVALRKSRGIVGALAVSHDDVAPGVSSIRTLAIRAAEQGRETALALLARGLACSRDREAQIAEIYVNPADEKLVNMCRTLGFAHDQTDICYTWPPAASTSEGNSR